MKIDLDKFVERFENSGMTQKQFAIHEGISSSMVSYYLRKAKSQCAEDIPPSFSQLVIEKPSTKNPIIITTSSGVKIEIPT